MAKGNSGTRRPGGGIGSRVNVEKPVRVGNRASVVNPRAVSQIGQTLGNKAATGTGRTVRPAETTYGAREPKGGPGGVELGNARAASTVCGVGGSREVMRSSTQGTHGPVASGSPRPGANKPIFPGF